MSRLSKEESVYSDGYQAGVEYGRLESLIDEVLRTGVVRKMIVSNTHYGMASDMARESSLFCFASYRDDDSVEMCFGPQLSPERKEALRKFTVSLMMEQVA